MSDKELEQEILALENEVKRLEDSTKEIIQSIKERIQNLKDIAWDRQSKKESAQMFNVLQGEKESTQVKSNVGDIRVDKDFMQKEIQKHLNNPELRGMVTTQEMLSFPKVAKNVGAEYDKRHQGYTWKTKADDENTLIYGSREYKINEKDTNRLLTNYSETEYGERQGRGEQGQLRREFNDRDFLRPATESITQNNENKITHKSITEQSKDFNHLSISQRLDILEKNQQAIAGMQSTKDLQQQNKDSMSIKQEAESKDSKSQESQMHKLKKRK